MSPMLTCREVEGFILDYLDGNLPTFTRMKFKFHVAMCRECRQYLRDYRIAMELGHRAFGEGDAVPEEVPEELIQAILAAGSRSTNQEPD